MVDVQFRFRDDETVNDPAVTVDSFSEQSNATTDRNDVRDLLQISIFGLIS